MKHFFEILFEWQSIKKCSLKFFFYLCTLLSDDKRKKERRTSNSTSQHSTTTTTTTNTETKDPEPAERPHATVTESTGRSAAIERAYVHDVYENCEDPNNGRAVLNPSVSKFLAGLEPGSFVCDVGSGDGRYLSAHNPLVYTIGVDRCYRLTKLARGHGGEVSEIFTLAMLYFFFLHLIGTL